MSRSHVEWFNLILAARYSFEETATLTAEALDCGVPASWIARASREAILADRSLRRELYTSATAIGYHARTGRILRLQGVLPEGFALRDVQALIVTLPADAVDRILESVSTQGNAIQELQRVARRVSARNRQAALV